MSSHCAIIGAEVVNALGVGAEEVWSKMMDGVCGIRPLRRFPHGKYVTDFAAELAPEAEEELRAQEGTESGGPAYLMALYVARRVLERTRPLPTRGRDRAVGLVLSTTKAEVGELERLVTEPGARGNARYNPYVLACDVAGALGINGPVLAVSNACASGLIALVEAARLLQRGEAAAVLVVGVDILADFVLSGFSVFQALSPQPCRPYDADRDGLSLGEGAGALLLTREPSRSDRILAEFTGWGITNDAGHITAPSRSGDGLKAAVTRALMNGGLTCDDIHYVNGHGTATVYNDEMEARALHDVFGQRDIPVSSMKGYFGHTLGAAGVIESVLCLAALREQTVPASLGFNRLGVSRPLHVPKNHLVLGEMRNVLSVKSGFGGVNAAVVFSRTRNYR